MKNGIQIKRSVSFILLFIIFLALGFRASASTDFFKIKHVCSQQKTDQSPCEESEKETDAEGDDDDTYERFFISCLIFNEPFDLQLNSCSAGCSFYSLACAAANPHTPVYLSNRILRL